MAKTDATNRRKRRSKVVTSEVAEEHNGNTEGQTESTEITQEEEDRDEQDSQIDAVIEVKASTPTVTVSWEKKNEEGEDRKMIHSGEQPQTVSMAEATGNTPSESSETKMEEIKDEQENESTPAVTVTWTKKNEEGQSSHNKQETKGSEQMAVKETGVKGKRKAAHPDTETSPSKKSKLINDGFCLFVGNLNKSKTFEEIRDSLASYFMTQSLLVQDIRLDRSKKHAFVDLASQMDLTKALTLNGEKILDKPVTVAKAKVKSADDVKVKAPQVDKKAKNARCLFLKNVPYNATKKDILKVFHKAVSIRFPGGTKGPSQGIAFVEFKNKTIAKKVQQKKQGVKIQGRVLIVYSVGEPTVPEVAKTNDEDKNTKAPPNNILFVSNLSYNVKEKSLNKVFQNAVSIKMPQNNDKSKGFAFVEFATVADAEKALQASQNMKISKRQIRVQFFVVRGKPKTANVISKTLIVRGLSQKTTAETLKSSFEGALSARVIMDKETGVSKSFGFVEFESEENCKAVRKAMEDCVIEGSKVTVAYAKPQSERSSQGARARSAGRPAGQPAGRGAGRAGRGSRGGKGRGAGVPQDAAKEVENKG
ncbi:nucleolin-like isoform X2 [Trachinotus anak]|uniref:nucleolin-like isoform X2 n=1 Tax=Trachinotus anak TaxID=443729 RepID=UPI0039F18792